MGKILESTAPGQTRTAQTVIARRGAGQGAWAGRRGDRSRRRQPRLRAAVRGHAPACVPAKWRKGWAGRCRGTRAGIAGRHLRRCAASPAGGMGTERRPLSRAASPCVSAARQGLAFRPRFSAACRQHAGGGTVLGAVQEAESIHCVYPHRLTPPPDHCDADTAALCEGDTVLRGCHRAVGETVHTTLGLASRSCTCSSWAQCSTPARPLTSSATRRWRR